VGHDNLKNVIRGTDPLITLIKEAYLRNQGRIKGEMTGGIKIVASLYLKAFYLTKCQTLCEVMPFG